MCRYYALMTRSIEAIVKDKDSNIGHVVLELVYFKSFSLDIICNINNYSAGKIRLQ